MTLQNGWLKRQFELSNKTIQGWSEVKQQVIFRNTTVQQQENIYPVPSTKGTTKTNQTKSK